jgi:hypothetical protein
LAKREIIVNDRKNFRHEANTTGCQMGMGDGVEGEASKKFTDATKG